MMLILFRSQWEVEINCHTFMAGVSRGSVDCLGEKSPGGGAPPLGPVLEGSTPLPVFLLPNPTLHMLGEGSRKGFEVPLPSGTLPPYQPRMSYLWLQENVMHNAE